MPIVVNCPTCSRSTRVPEKLTGRRFKCPECGESLKASWDGLGRAASVPWYRSNAAVALAFIGLGLLIVGAIPVALTASRHAQETKAAAQDRAEQEAREAAKLAEQKAKLDAKLAANQALRADQETKTARERATEAYRRGVEEKENQEVRDRAALATAERDLRSLLYEHFLYRFRLKLLLLDSNPVKERTLEKDERSALEKWLKVGGKQENVDRLMKQEFKRADEQADAELAYVQKNAIQVEAGDLIRAYEENEVDADRRFKGKGLKVSGTVSSVSSDSGKGATIFLQPSYTNELIFGSVGCKFTYKSQVEGVKAKYRYSNPICGKCEGKTFTVAFLKGCDWKP